jgi:hypothetical protein
MLRSTPVGRSVPFALAVALLVAACTSGGGDGASPSTEGPKPGTPTAGSTIAQLSQGAEAVSLLSSGSAMNPGTESFSFALITNENPPDVITGGSPQVYLAKDESSPAVGPFAAAWYPFAPASEFDDTSPRSALPGTYFAQIEADTTGNLLVAVLSERDGHPIVGTAALTVTDQAVPAQIGTKAISVETPVATTEEEARQIDTRDPPSPLHYISLDQALTNGKPTVVVFATPLLCESMLCGPVVDEVLLVYEKVGKDAANFIHVEEFLPGPDLTPPPATLENISPAFKAWGFQTEPWTIVIDRGGIIQARFEGPVTAAIIEAALQPLL